MHVYILIDFNSRMCSCILANCLGYLGNLELYLPRSSRLPNVKYDFTLPHVLTGFCTSNKYCCVVA